MTAMIHHEHREGSEASATGQRYEVSHGGSLVESFLLLESSPTPVFCSPSCMFHVLASLHCSGGGEILGLCPTAAKASGGGTNYSTSSL